MPTRNANGLFMCAMSNDRKDFFPSETLLTGSRVALAFLELSDAEELLYLVNSSRKALSEWLPWVENFRSIGDARTSISAYELQREMGNGGAFGIRRLDDGAFVGEIVLQWLDVRNRSASLGYFLGDAFWGKGLAAEAGTLALGYLREMGIHRVEISAAAENEKSNALAERLGFFGEGVARDAEYLHGKFWDHNRWAMVL